MVIDLSATMDAIAAAITAAGLAERSYPYPAGDITPPCAVVGYPKSIDIGITFGRGGDSAEIPLWIVAGQVSDESTRDALSAAISGASDVQTALEGDLGGVVSALRVTGCTPETVSFAGVTYMSARFDLEVLS